MQSHVQPQITEMFCSVPFWNKSAELTVTCAHLNLIKKGKASSEFMRHWPRTLTNICIYPVSNFSGTFTAGTESSELIEFLNREKKDDA